MHRLISTFIKEFKILIVDRTGITILFVMPVLLVLIMTLIQHAAYKSLTQSGIPVILVNNDNDSLGLAIEKGFKKFSICDLTVDNGIKYRNSAEIKKHITDGEFIVAVVIPKNATNVLRLNVKKMVNGFFEKQPLSNEISKQVKIEIIVDPTASKSFIMAINSGLKEFIASIKTKVTFQILSENISELMEADKKTVLPDEDFFTFDESYALRDSTRVYQPNAVQHNIPAWSIFSIFFIVLPLAGSIINERSEGIFIRMRTFPGSYLTILSGKLFVYFLVAIIQFSMIVLLGKYILPLLGLPILDIGTHFLALFMLTVTLSLASVSYGLLIGTLFNTPQQSAVFGGISILIMSALGGIWVPVNIMPPIMHTISSFSPLNWALIGYYELFIKGGDWFSIQNQVLKLGSFFIISIVISFRLYKFKLRLL